MGIVSSRVALLLRSAEIQPFSFDLFGSPPKLLTDFCSRVGVDGGRAIRARHVTAPEITQGYQGGVTPPLYSSSDSRTPVELPQG